MNPNSDPLRVGAGAGVPARALATNKLIRNTYTLLSMTLIFSAVMAAVSVFLSMPPMTYLLCIGGAIVLMWFVLPRTQDSAMGLVTVFGITGLMGFGLGPLLSMWTTLLIETTYPRKIARTPFTTLVAKFLKYPAIVYPATISRQERCVKFRELVCPTLPRRMAWN